MTTDYLTEHNIVELLKNQLAIQSIANKAKLDKGLMHIINTQTQSFSAIAQKSGINVEQIEAELAEEINIGIKDWNKGMEKYLGNVKKRTT